MSDQYELLMVTIRQSQNRLNKAVQEAVELGLEVSLNVDVIVEKGMRCSKIGITVKETLLRD